MVSFSPQLLRECASLSLPSAQILHGNFTSSPTVFIKDTLFYSHSCPDHRDGKWLHLS